MSGRSNTVDPVFYDDPQQIGDLKEKYWEILHRAQALELCRYIDLDTVRIIGALASTEYSWPKDDDERRYLHLVAQDQSNFLRGCELLAPVRDRFLDELVDQYQSSSRSDWFSLDLQRSIADQPKGERFVLDHDLRVVTINRYFLDRFRDRLEERSRERLGRMAEPSDQEERLTPWPNLDNTEEWSQVDLDATDTNDDAIVPSIDVSPDLASRVWNRYHDHDKGPCFLCGTTLRRFGQRGWTIAPIDPRSQDRSQDDLRIICRTCQRSLGGCHMYLYANLFRVPNQTMTGSLSITSWSEVSRGPPIQQELQKPQNLIYRLAATSYRLARQKLEELMDRGIMTERQYDELIGRLDLTNRIEELLSAIDEIGRL